MIAPFPGRRRWCGESPKMWVRDFSKVAVHTLLGIVFPPRILLKLPRSAGAAVCLTFDDGPDGRNTRRILQILQDEGVRATFFIDGLACERHPELVQAMVAEGHEVANHGYSHLAANEATPADYVADVERGQQILEATVGHSVPRFFRPPFGRLSARTFLGLWWRGYRFVLWSVDSGDSFLTEADDVVTTVLEAPVAAGSIVLLHEDYARTVEALPALIARIRARGLAFATLASARTFPVAGRLQAEGLGGMTGQPEPRRGGVRP